MLSGFSWEYAYPRYQLPPRGMPYFLLSDRNVDLPASLNAYGIQRAYPSARGSVTAPSPRRPTWKSRNINRVSHRPRRSAET